MGQQSTFSEFFLSACSRAVPLLLAVTIVVGITLAASMADAVIQRRVVLALVHVVMVVGLYIFMGNSGVLNFSAVGFMAVGAYASALLTMKPMAKQMFLPDLPTWLAEMQFPLTLGPALGGFVAAGVAVVIGGPIMRLSGIAAGIATFSLMFIIYVVIGNWNTVTGGQTSLMGLTAWVGLWQACLGAVVCIAIAWAYQETRWALALQASRSDLIAASASGIHVVGLRFGAFVLSAFVFGIAGGLYGHFQGTLRVDSFYLDPTFLYVAMLVVGGVRSLTGAVIGAVSVSALAEVLRQLELGVSLPMSQIKMSIPLGLGDVVLPALMLFVLVFRPQGVMGSSEQILTRYVNRLGNEHHRKKGSTV